METAKFRFTDEYSCEVVFMARIATAAVFAEDLGQALIKFETKNPNRRAALHMHHDRRWMPINKDCGVQTIVARTDDPKLWAERISQEVLDLWADLIRHADNIDRLIGRAIKNLDLE